MTRKLHRQPTADGHDALSAGWSRWLADCRVDEAAAARARQRSLERQAAQESNIAGVLLDLGEQGQPVTVKTASGHSCHGQVAAVGADFALICDDSGNQLLIPVASIATISASPAGRTVTGARLGPSAALADVIHELATDQAQVEVVVADECISGLLKTAGTDVIGVDVGSPLHGRVHVATAAIDHLVVLAR